jgi:hypothetical protein
VSGLPLRWGATSAEHDQDQLADGLLPPPRLRMTRAVAVRAPASLVFRWICQLSVAPYSYDLLDNRGRRSPRTLTPGADDLQTGQQVMGIFRVVDVRPGSELTLRGLPRATRLFGQLALTYSAQPQTASTTRLVCRIVTSTPTGPGRARATLLAWGDLVMMRKQLRTLAALAERDAARDRDRDDT